MPLICALYLSQSDLNAKPSLRPGRANAVENTDWLLKVPMKFCGSFHNIWRRRMGIYINEVSLLSTSDIWILVCKVNHWQAKFRIFVNQTARLC